jgi:hypothetical protein
MRRVASLVIAAAALALGGCAATTPAAKTTATEASQYTPDRPLPGAVSIAFAIPRTAEAGGFLDTPWPTELRRLPGGRLDLRAFPGRGTAVFGPYVEAAERDVEGFPLSPTVYFRFTGAAPAPRLPAEPRALAAAKAPVFLVDVDPASPERGRFVPLEHRWYDTELAFVPARTLAVKPVPGVVLRPATLYAAVVRRELGGGADLGTPMDLEIVKWTRPRADPREERARTLHEGALDQLAAIGVPRDRVASIALFRTHAPHLVTARLVDVIAHLSPRHAPRVVSAKLVPSIPGLSRNYRTIVGTYCTPNFQSEIGLAPFLSDDGGRFLLDASGAPRVVELPPESPYRSDACGGLIHARFVLTFPLGDAPAKGFPLMVSAHGTGGDARSFLGEHDFAGWAASQGIAVVSTDQPLHGSRGPAPRPGSREPIAIRVAGIPIPISNDPSGAEVAFYNPIHPAAARDNLRQAAADLMVLARLFTSADVAEHLPPEVPRFDRTRVLAAGHSQGSQSVAAAGAVDPLIRGVVLSGCGGDARLGILRRDDLPIVPLFSTLLGLAPGELDEMHPLMALVQALADPIDPASYARLYWEPLPGRRPPSVIHYEGLGDSYNPPVTAEALAVALRATPVAPLVQPVAGIDAPVTTLDMLAARGQPVRAFVQLEPTGGENGHFVLYHEPAASELLRRFLRAAIARP